jgi:hypothetical protein
LGCTGLKPCDFNEVSRDTVSGTEIFLQEHLFDKSITYHMAYQAHNLKAVHPAAGPNEHNPELFTPPLS